MTLFLFVVGLGLLILGAELLVRGSSRLAAAIGISPLVIGLTVVAFGTSAPEFAVSIKAALSGQGSIAVGNVIGSNIFNVLFILGLAALIAPLVVSRQLVRIDVPLMIVVSLVVLLLAWDAKFSRVDGMVLFTGLIGYTGFLIYYSRRHPEDVPVETAQPEQTGRRDGWLRNVLLVASGLGLLVLGSRWLVNGAVSIAQAMGVSELIIGLTIIAAGTSLPEVVTSVVASVKGERDIAVGNVVGSNLFNAMGVLGLAAVIAPDGIEVASSVISFDIPIMIAVAFACLPIFFTGGGISRWEGGLLFSYYVAYTAYLILAASKHDALPIFSGTMLYFVIPLTVLTLAVVSVNAFRKNRTAAGGTAS